ncbi:hypothetical protein AKJ16_DCAP12509 [Drosera capensis]
MSSSITFQFPSLTRLLIDYTNPIFPLSSPSSSAQFIRSRKRDERGQSSDTRMKSVSSETISLSTGK